MKRRKRLKLRKPIKRFLFFFILLSVIVIANGTFAKYISNTNGTSSVDVAKFKFTLKDKDQILAENFVYNLAGNITDGNNLSKSGLCPGKSGQIDMIIDMSDTEVKTKYAIYMSPKQTIPSNLKFYSDSSYDTEINLGAVSVINGEINLDDINTPITKTIYWKWIWDEETDENEYEENEFLFDIKVVVMQATR